MLLWQHKKRWRKRHTFWFALLCVSALFHCVIMIFAVIIKSKNESSISLLVSKSLSRDIPVIFLPLHKRVERKTTSSMAVVNRKNGVAPKIKQKIAVMSPQQKESTIISPKTKQHTTVLNKDTIKKEVQSNAVQNKLVPSPKAAHDKKIDQKNAAVAKKNEEIAACQSITQEPALYVGRAELSALQLQARIKQEIQALWKPPRGLAKNLSCDIKICVDLRGAIKNLTIVRSSGVLLYDLSARNALATITLPAWAYDKELCITFKQ